MAAITLAVVTVVVAVVGVLEEAMTVGAAERITPLAAGRQASAWRALETLDTRELPATG